MINISEETIQLPTYQLGEADILPLFLEKRAYQGSSGKVYPYRVTDQLLGIKKDCNYKVVILENDYLKVIVMPELGGRIQMAYDKIQQRHFIYYNQVIKPALVGLTGPWISGGIEFNWPQHHRPSTFEPLEYCIKAESNYVSVYLGELERMNNLQQCLCISLYQDKNYIELNGRIFNNSPLPQTFLWWANPAVQAAGGHQSIFPPDVTAVYDHGKRDVSKFPIATGEYYKADYSRGVDISRYDNIPVPTSYMAWRSNYNFVGAYVEEEKGGLLHVANHFIAPGKKQWTWGNGHFGQTWDRNLTDEDGPYIELMTGVYTDNQPDFTWLDPYEEKQFTQYFMPYRELGRIHNASERFALKCELHPHSDNSSFELELGILTFSEENDFKVGLWLQDRVILEDICSLNPRKIWQKQLKISNEELGKDIICRIVSSNGEQLLEYRRSFNDSQELEEFPDPASTPLPPEQIQHIDELIFIGQHIEQYRNPSLEAESYYLEALHRDSLDYRANLAMARLKIRSYEYHIALIYLENALQRQMCRNTNPIDGEASYLKGLSLLTLGSKQEALKSFYRSIWSQNYKANALYYITVIYVQNKQWQEALTSIEQAVIQQGNNWQIQSLKAYILRKSSRQNEAQKVLDQILAAQPLHFVAQLEQQLLKHNAINNYWLELLRLDSHNILSTAYLYHLWGEDQLAFDIAQNIPDNSDPMQYYALAFFAKRLKQPFQEFLLAGDNCENFRHFPNRELDYKILQFAIDQKPDSLAQYYLGNLLYDRKRYSEAFDCWQQLPDHGPSKRNCSIYLYNKQQNIAEALNYIQAATVLMQNHPRVIFEYSCLLRLSGKTAGERNTVLMQYKDLLNKRDDLLLEFLNTLLLLEIYQEVLDLISKHNFYPWEGGEGKISECYVNASIGKALQKMTQDNLVEAGQILNSATVLPENINEGKLINRTENDIYYYLGCIYERMGQMEDAQACWRKAIKGSSEISISSYYNDTPIEYILYQSLAYRKLGDEAMARRKAYLLIDFGEKNYGKKLQADFFAVSMPDFSVFEIDREQEFQEKCLFSLILGYYCMEDYSRMEKFSHDLFQLNPNHISANLFLHWSKLLYHSVKLKLY